MMMKMNVDSEAIVSAAMSSATYLVTMRHTPLYVQHTTTENTKFQFNCFGTGEQVNRRSEFTKARC